MPGIGKSFYAKRLAKDQTIQYLDLDQHIEEIKGETIANIINTQGEEFFRLYEAIALRKITLDNSLDLISTGGGTPCFCDNIDYMQSNGKVIYLSAQPAYLIELYRKYQLSRPLASGQNIDEYIQATYQKRHPIYSLADYIIDVSKGQETIIKELASVIELANDSNK
jgi:shikimate kinase